MTKDPLAFAYEDAVDYDITPLVAEFLLSIVALPAQERLVRLAPLNELDPLEFANLFAQFIGMANSVVANSAEMADILLMTAGVTHPDQPSTRANLPTIVGALRGIVMAQGVDASKVCEGCAFRLGTVANQSPITTTEADMCVEDSEKFMCHMELDRKGQPFKACAGYAQTIKAKGAAT